MTMTEKLQESFACNPYRHPWDLDGVRALLDAGADINASSFTSCIGQACQWGQVDMVRLLLEYRPDLSGTLGDTITCFQPNENLPRRLQILKMLLDAGANPNHDGCPTGNFTVICMLSQYEHPHYVKCPSLYWPYLEGVLEMLLEYGADVNGFQLSFYRSNLEYAISLGSMYPGTQRPDVWLVDALIRHGADVNLKLNSFPDMEDIFDDFSTVLDHALYRALEIGPQRHQRRPGSWWPKEEYELDGLVYTITLLLDAGAVPYATWKLERYRTMIAGHPRSRSVNHHVGELILEKKKRACRIITRYLWKRVQRRQQLELLDELYKPGGLGALRGQRRFDVLMNDL